MPTFTWRGTDENVSNLEKGAPAEATSLEKETKYSTVLDNDWGLKGREGQRKTRKTGTTAKSRKAIEKTTEHRP